MTEALARYPYLFSNAPLALLAVGLAFVHRSGPWRRLAIAAGLACVPCCLLWRPFEDYWHPVVLVPPLRIEDVAHLYWTGSAGWMAAALWLPREWAIGVRSGAVVLLRLSVLAGAVAVFVALWLAGANVMSAALSMQLLLLAALLWRRPGLWRLALGGTATMAPLYVSVVKVHFALWPGYVGCWSATRPWGALVWGVPVGELAWAVCFNAMWPVLVAWAFDVRLDRRAAA
jgi:hypothetical protein